MTDNPLKIILAGALGRMGKTLTSILLESKNFELAGVVEIPENIKNHLDIVPVRWIDEVFKRALEREPQPRLIRYASTISSFFQSFLIFFRLFILYISPSET